MKLFWYSLLLSCYALSQVPDSDIWLFQLKKKDHRYICTKPVNMTNRIGYDNQPEFMLDGKSLLYTSIGNDQQADIYRYDIKTRKHTNLTKSKVSEYSPSVTPTQTGFTAVVVEEDSAQRIWEFSMDGASHKLFHEATDSVGYYTRLGRDTLLYDKLTQPHSLHALDVMTHKDIWLCDNPSRSFKPISGTTQFIYAIKDSAGCQFRIYNPLLRESKVYIAHASWSDDFMWHTELGLLKSENADILKYNEHAKQWETLFSFSAFGIKKVTRFVFDYHNKQLAIVSQL